MSGSMQPAIHTGDVVVDESIAPAEARVGDVVTFKDPTPPADHPLPAHCAAEGPGPPDGHEG